MRAEHEQKREHLLLAELRDQLVGRSPPPTSVGIERVELLRVGEDLAEHPRAGDDDHDAEADDLRDEGERLLLDLRDRLEDRDSRPTTRPTSSSGSATFSASSIACITR